MAEKVHRTHNPRQFSGGAVYLNDYGSVHVSPTGYLHSVNVKPEHRGQGHMRGVMSMAKNDADIYGHTLYTNAEQEFLAQILRASDSWSEEDIRDKAHPRFAHLPSFVRRPVSKPKE